MDIEFQHKAPTSDLPPDDAEQIPESAEPTGDCTDRRNTQPHRAVFTPPIDIFETEEGLVLHADLPGVTLETLELQIQDKKLILFGRVKPPVPDDAEAVHLEYEVGDFLRSFILSDDVDHDRIQASLNNGVLKIVLPKAPAAEPRFIQVKSD